MSAKAATAYVDIDADLATFERKAKQAISDVLSKFSTVEQGPQVGGDFSGLQRQAAAASSDAAGKIKGIPDAQVGGDFSRLESEASGASTGVKGKLNELGGWAKGAMAGAGLAAGAALSAGIIRSIDVEKGQDKLAGQLGVTGKVAQTAGRIAGDLWRNAYGDSLDEVNEALAGVHQNIRGIGKVSEKEITTATRDTLNLASTFGQETGQISRTVGALIRNGMAKNTREAFDLLTVGFQRGANSGDEFLDTLNEYAEPVKSLGLNARDFTDILVRGAKNGVWSVDKIGDALKEFQIRVIDGSELTKTSFQQIGLNADVMGQKFGKGGESAKAAMSQTIQAIMAVDDPVKREMAGVGLFGAMWEDIGPKAIAGMDPAIHSLGKTEGAADKLDATLNDNFGTKLETLKRKVIGGFGDLLSKTVVPALNDFADAIMLGPTLDELGKAIQEVGSLADTWLGKAIFGVIGTALRMTGQQIQGFVGIMRGAFQMIRGVVNVFAGLLTLDFDRAWTGVKQIFGGAITSILGSLRMGFAPILAVAKTLGGAITSGFDVVKGIPGVVTGALSSAAQWLVNFVVSFASKAAGLGRAIFNGIVDVVKSAPGAVSTWLAGVAQSLLNHVVGFAAKAASLGRSIFNGVVDVVRGIPGAVGNWLGNAAQTVVNWAGDFAAKGLSLGKALLNGIADGARQIKDTVLNALKEPINAFIRLWNSFEIPGFDPPGPGPKFPAIGLPDIQELARGTTDFSGGLALYGEKGPELGWLPEHFNMLDARRTRALLKSRPAGGAQLRQGLGEINQHNEFEFRVEGGGTPDMGHAFALINAALAAEGIGA